MTRGLSDLAKQTAAYGVVGMALRGFALLLIPFYTRVFTPAEYGLLDTWLVVAMVASTAMGLNLSSALMRFYWEVDGPENRRLLFSTGFWALVGTAILSFLALAYMRPVAMDALGIPTTRYGVYIILLGMLYALFSYLQIVHRMEERLLAYGSYAISAVAVSAVSVIYLVWFQNRGLGGALEGMLIGFGTVGLLLLATMRQKLVCRISPKVLKSMLSFGLPGALAIIIAWLNLHLARFWIRAWLPDSELGIYSVASKFGGIILIGTSVFGMSWWPFAIKKASAEDRDEVYRRAFSYFLLVGLSATVWFLPFGNFSVAVLATSDYSGAATIIGFLMLAMVVDGANRIMQVGSVLQYKTYINGLAMLSGLVVLVILIHLGLRAYGLQGLSLFVFVANVITISLNYLWDLKTQQTGFQIRRAGIGLIITAAFIAILNALASSLLLLPKLLMATVTSTALFFVLLDHRERARVARRLAQLPSIIARGASLGWTRSGVDT